MSTPLWVTAFFLCCCLPLALCAQGLPHHHKTILILGNSIVRHEPAPHIGWQGDWGMAASVADSDFVHLLIRNANRRSPGTSVRYLNISSFERDYAAYKLSELDSFRNPDILIVKLSENVNDYTVLQNDFIHYYGRLLDYLDTGKKAARIIVNGFWRAPNVQKVLSNYARYHHYPFISITDLSSDSGSTAAGLFSNPGVASHPSDKGMRLIAERIWAVLKLYL